MSEARSNFHPYLALPVPPYPLDLPLEDVQVAELEEQLRRLRDGL